MRVALATLGGGSAIGCSTAFAGVETAAARGFATLAAAGWLAAGLAVVGAGWVATGTGGTAVGTTAAVGPGTLTGGEGAGLVKLSSLSIGVPLGGVTARQICHPPTTSTSARIAAPVVLIREADSGCAIAPGELVSRAEPGWG